MSKLDPDRIRENLNTQWLGSKVVVYESTASTNDVAAEYARNPQNHGLVVLAEQQHAGRGRGGNSWVASKGDSILASLIVNNRRGGTGLLSLAVAVGIANTLGLRARIKWPNDILINQKKICGILLESRAFANHQATIIGFGINCHQRQADFPPALWDQAISLDMVGLGRVDRSDLTRRLLVELERWLDRVQGDPQAVVEAWKQRSMQLGHRVSLEFDGKLFQGQCLGVDPEEGLLVRLDHGGVRYFAAGQTHVVRD